jgi:hypothetical protein
MSSAAATVGIPLIFSAIVMHLDQYMKTSKSHGGQSLILATGVVSGAGAPINDKHR